jgi:hypothetical protein
MKDIDKPVLEEIRVMAISQIEAKKLLVQNHYLHSFPGGTMLSFGVFFKDRLLGVVTLGIGPYRGYGHILGANQKDCLTLTRLWLSDELPRNSESKVIGIVLRALKRDTSLKYVLAYSDPTAGHVGTIYQATNWLYIGISAATPLYSVEGGLPCHSRTLGHKLGSHSIRYLTSRGLDVKTVPQSPKHRYIYFLDQSWRSRLTLPILPYPKKECDLNGSH